VKPTSHVLPSILVLKGQYAQLNNIDDNHKFIKDLTFWIGDVKKVHKEGASAGKLMWSLVELRKIKPELFKGLVVYQQPAAFVDEIIQAWMIRDSAERVPQAIHQRDLFAAALTKSSRDGMKLAQQLESFIAPKMTPVLQLTDTDIAFILKRVADQTKAQISRELRARALVDGEKAVLDNLSLENIMRIAQEAHAGVEAKNAELNLILAGARRNGMLSYRPDFTQNKLVRSDSQDWAKSLPEGSHRMKESWLDNRYSWNDADGKPVGADWTKIDHATDVADLAEADYSSKLDKHTSNHSVRIGDNMIEIPVVSIEAEQQSIIPQEEMIDFLNPKQRRLRQDAQKQAVAADKKVVHFHTNVLQTRINAHVHKTRLPFCTCKCSYYSCRTARLQAKIHTCT